MQMRKIYNLEQERGIHIQRKKTHYFIVNLQIITLAASPSGYSGPCYSASNLSVMILTSCTSSTTTMTHISLRQHARGSCFRDTLGWVVSEPRKSDLGIISGTPRLSQSVPAVCLSRALLCSISTGTNCQAAFSPGSFAATQANTCSNTV